jgi:hypothetical protein
MEPGLYGQSAAAELVQPFRTYASITCAELGTGHFADIIVAVVSRQHIAYDRGREGAMNTIKQEVT